MNVMFLIDIVLNFFMAQMTEDFEYIEDHKVRTFIIFKIFYLAYS